MGFKRKIMICAAALASVGLGPGSTADAQVGCRHIGMWTRTVDGFVCAGDYYGGQCVWTDDCRKNVE
jgi:hypothetical protein